MTGIKTIEESWIDYRDKAYPDGMHRQQSAALHKAFVAGAVSTLLTITFDIPELTEQEGVAVIDALLKESRALAEHPENIT